MNWFTVGDVAYLTGLSNSTIRRAVERGRLVGTLTPGGHNRFTPSQVHLFCVTLGLL